MGSIILLFSLLFAVPLIQGYTDGFSFECGDNEPPSGPYLDLDLMQYFRYSCTTGVLVPDEPATERCSVEFVDGKARPLKGICLVLNEVNGGYSDRYEYQPLVALLGNYPTISVRTWDVRDDTALEVDCVTPETCSGVPLATAAVTFWHTPLNYYTLGDCVDHSSTGQISAEGPTDAVTANAETTARWCRQ